MSSVPPSSSFCLRGTCKRLLCRPFGLSASLCRISCFVVIARFRFPHQSATWRSCVRSEKGGQRVLTLCSLAFRLTWWKQLTPSSPRMPNNSDAPGRGPGKISRLSLFDFLNSAGSPRAASFLQLCLAVRENEESKQLCQRSRMPNSIIVWWRRTRATFPQLTWCLTSRTNFSPTAKTHRNFFKFPSFVGVVVISSISQLF